MPTMPHASRQIRERLRAWFLFFAGLFVVMALVPAPFGRAQEPGKDAAPAKDDAAKAAAPEAESKAPAPRPDAGTEPPPQRNMLQWARDASGPIGWVLLGISVYLVAMVIRFFMEFRLPEAVPPALVERLDTAIKEKKFQEAYDACRDNESFLARLVRTGVANLPNGRPEAKEAMNIMSEEIVAGMEQRISYLAIIGQLGPMIGLVGTIWGMIMSFNEIANAAGSQPKPAKVAEGISTALFITLEGVTLAIPAIFFFSFFRNRIAVIAMDANRVADRVLTALVNAAKQSKTA
jgi:biopolymer transport protein ExbB